MIEIIKNIDSIFKYFVPGYFFISIFLLITDRTKYDIKHKVLNSIIFSVLLHIFLSVCYKCVGVNIALSLETVTLIEVVISSVLGVIVGFLSHNEKFIRLFSRLFLMSPHSNIWHDICLPNKNIYCKAYLKDHSIICGSIQEIETNKDNPYIIINRYTMVDDKEEMSFQNISTESVFVISMNNVEKLLITYTDQK